MNEVLHLNFFDFAISHLDFSDFRFFKFRFSFSYSMIIQYYWWIIQCNECSTTQIGSWVLGCEQGFALKFLEFDILIRIRSPSSLSSIQYYWWIAMTALRLRAAMCVPMYLFEHHLACDLFFAFDCLDKSDVSSILNYLISIDPFSYSSPRRSGIVRISFTPSPVGRPEKMKAFQNEKQRSEMAYTYDFFTFIYFCIFRKSDFAD